MTSHDIFISYKSEEQSLALSVKSRLEEEGYTCWIDTDIRAAGDYAAEICNAIKSAQAFVLIFTEAAQESDDIKNEVALAVRHLGSDRVFPYKIGDFKENDSFSYHFATIQVKKELDEILAALREQITPSGMPLSIENAVTTWDDLCNIWQQYATPDSEEVCQKKIAYAKKWFEKRTPPKKDTLSREELQNAVLTHITLGDIAWNSNNAEAASEHYQKLLALAEQLSTDNNDIKTRQLLAAAHLRNGIIAADEYDFEKADGFYQTALTLTDALLTETGSPEVKRMLGAIYGNLGHSARNRGETDIAKQHYEKSLIFRQIFAAETGSRQAWSYIATMCVSLGNIAAGEKNTEAAKRYYERSRSIRESVFDESDPPSRRRSLALIYIKLGDMAKAEHDPTKAAEFFEKALLLLDGIAAELKSTPAKRDLSVCHNKLGNLAIGENDLEKAEKHFHAALSLRNEILKQASTAEAHRDLATSHEWLGRIEKLKGNIEGYRAHLEASLHIWETLTESWPDVSQYARRLSTMQKLLGELNAD